METAWLRVVPSSLAAAKNNAHPNSTSFSKTLKPWQAPWKLWRPPSTEIMSMGMIIRSPFATGSGWQSRWIASISDRRRWRQLDTTAAYAGLRATKNWTRWRGPWSLWESGCGGWGKWPRVLRQLNDALLPDTAQGRDAVAADDTASSATSEVGWMNRGRELLEQSEEQQWALNSAWYKVEITNKMIKI